MPPRRTATPRPQPPSPTQPKKSSSRKQPICTLAPTSHAFTTSPASDLVTVQGFQLLGFVQFLGVAISTLFLQGVLNGLVVYVWGKSPEIARASKGTANGWGLISGLAAWKVVEVGLGLSILGLNGKLASVSGNLSSRFLVAKSESNINLLHALEGKHPKCTSLT